MKLASQLNGSHSVNYPPHGVANLNFNEKLENLIKSADELFEAFPPNKLFNTINAKYNDKNTTLHFDSSELLLRIQEHGKSDIPKVKNSKFTSIRRKQREDLSKFQQMLSSYGESVQRSIRSRALTMRASMHNSGKRPVRFTRWVCLSSNTSNTNLISCVKTDYRRVLLCDSNHKCIHDKRLRYPLRGAAEKQQEALACIDCKQKCISDWRWFLRVAAAAERVAQWVDGDLSGRRTADSHALHWPRDRQTLVHSKACNWKSTSKAQQLNFSTSTKIKVDHSAGRVFCI